MRKALAYGVLLAGLSALSCEQSVPERMVDGVTIASEIRVRPISVGTAPGINSTNNSIAIVAEIPWLTDVTAVIPIKCKSSSDGAALMAIVNSELTTASKGVVFEYQKDETRRNFSRVTSARYGASASIESCSTNKDVFYKFSNGD